MNEELEPEVLSYREFRNRQTLRDWELRRRAFEPQRGRRGENRAGDFLTPTALPKRSPSPPGG